MAQKLLESTYKNALFNILYQLLSKCISFICNAFVLRYTSQAVMGVINVRLLLLESTILFLSREAFRRACLSQIGLHSWTQIINLMWLTVPLSVVMSLLFSFIWLNVINVPSVDVTPHYAIGVWSISVSCIIEMFSEPFCFVSQAFLLNIKVIINVIILWIRTLTFAFWIFYFPDEAVLAFSVTHIIANIIYCLLFYGYFYAIIHKKEKNLVIQLLNKYSTFPVRENDNKVENMSRELKTESSKYLIKDGCGDKLLKLESTEVCTCNSSDACDKNHPKNESSLVGFDSELFPFKNFKDFFPSFKVQDHWVHPDSAQLTWSFFKNGVMKQVLTEGERYIMTSVMTFSQQGVYDTVSNLASLPPRLIFSQIEDNLSVYFSKTLRRDVALENQNQEQVKEAVTCLNQVLKCITSLSLVIVSFGQSYSSLLLYLYGGEALYSGLGPYLLRTYCFLVLLLGINGITECYTFSTMTADDLNKNNYFMAKCSVMFLVLSLALTHFFGEIGFIIANCFNICARIVRSIIIIRKKYENTSFKPLNGLKPNMPFIIGLTVALLVTKFTEVSYSTPFHISIGLICLTSVLFIWKHQEPDLAQKIIELLFQYLHFHKWKYKKNHYQ